MRPRSEPGGERQAFGPVTTAYSSLRGGDRDHPAYAAAYQPRLEDPSITLTYGLHLDPETVATLADGRDVEDDGRLAVEVDGVVTGLRRHRGEYGRDAGVDQVDRDDVPGEGGLHEIQVSRGYGGVVACVHVDAFDDGQGIAHQGDCCRIRCLRPRAQEDRDGDGGEDRDDDDDDEELDQGEALTTPHAVMASGLSHAHAPPSSLSTASSFTP
jgi:hypothetical protein